MAQASQTSAYHIYKFHIELYLEESEKQKWPIGIHPVGTCLSEGWTLTKILERLKNPTCTIEMLGPPPSCSDGSLRPAVRMAVSERGLPNFSIEEMYRHMVKFIIADDQPISIVECPEFCQLLRLLQQDLKESDIPHRSKFWQLIIEAWNEYFTAIKLDLATAQGRISFTSDIWSDSKLHPFLALIAHWIAKDSKNATLITEAKKYILKLMQNKRATNVSAPSSQLIHQPHPATLGSTIYGLPEINMLPHCQGGPQSVKDEFNAYSMGVLSPTGTDILSFWMVLKPMFPMLYKLTMDFLPIQASAVPCEHIFFSSSDTFIKKRNHLSSYLMEVLQIVKFSLKKDQLHFTKSWAASQNDMEYHLMYVTGSLSHEDLLTSGSDDLLISAVSGSYNFEALLRVITEDECDDVLDDIPHLCLFIS
ncbi:uncharacterized protein EDB93DRAFT_1255305 [Suillus bovinus]|uniref:uncharacterized protein n=1 Tax=Suillus bovinus TaxID=48563 RepID=UPI001B884595|nr:uncharacterized protein EDB93DRAFT_1255305 [Suillus bovinus]KAG2132119.1 hypothetical protein EDB93DRAFT_1255305 [Suillus bovinus]